MRKKLLLSLGLLFVLVGFTFGLFYIINSVNFNNAYKEYKQAQIAATWFIDGFEYVSVQQSMKNVSFDVLNNNLRDMEKARDKMQRFAKTEQQQRILYSVSVSCEDIEFMMYAKRRIDHLTAEESQRLFIILGIAGSSRREFLDEQK